MKSLMRIYFKYIATAVLLIMLFIAIQIGILGAVTVKLYGNGSEHGKYAVRQIYDMLHFADGEMASGQAEAITSLEEMSVSFAMVLDDAGQPVWTYRLPENLNHAYTASEIASFARWYLDDYPVSVWGGDKGLLVIGYPRGSIWNYHVRRDTKDLEGMMTFFSLSFVLTILAAIVVLLVSCLLYTSPSPRDA